MRLEVGTQAPVFKTQAIGGRIVDLAALRGRTVLLKFYRFATCPVCNLHLHHFIRDYQVLEALGLTTVVLFHSPAETLAETRREDAPFDLVPDPEKRIFRAFGVETGLRGLFSPTVMRDYARALAAGYPSGMFSHDGGILGNPADFIIDGDGRIAFAHYGRQYSDTLSAAAIADIRRSIDAGQPLPASRPAVQHA
ncbi:MAG TPA: peroxiredoxin-like family protein [Vicinamibacterales bacterium]|jgi:peroxiredoxin|nr:peroxiredoxin-like family protein [Vicinamibacterales bacterium]